MYTSASFQPCCHQSMNYRLHFAVALLLLAAAARAERAGHEGVLDADAGSLADGELAKESANEDAAQTLETQPIGTHSHEEASSGQPWSKAVLASNLKQLDRQRRELEDLLQAKLDATVKARDERASLKSQYDKVTSQLRDMVAEKNGREEKITQARRNLLGILHNYEAAVAAASRVLTCMKSDCRQMSTEGWVEKQASKAIETLKDDPGSLTKGFGRKTGVQRDEVVAVAAPGTKQNYTD